MWERVVIHRIPFEWEFRRIIPEGVKKKEAKLKQKNRQIKY